MGLVQFLGSKDYATTSSGMPNAGSATTIGNLIVAFITQTGVKSFTVGDAAANSYSRIAGASTANNQIFASLTTGSVANGANITPSWSVSDNVVFAAFEFSGYPLTVQANPGAQSGTGTTTTGTITAQVAPSLLLSGMRCASALIDGLTITEAAGWNQLMGVSGHQHPTAALCLSASYKETAAIGAVSHPVGLAPSEAWVDLLVELGMSPGGMEMFLPILNQG